MIKILLRPQKFLAWTFFLCVLSYAGILDMPPLGAVSDFASVLPLPAKDSIAYLSQSLLDKTGVPLVLVTVSDLEGADINDIATRLYEKWGIGKKGKDEGALVLLSVKDRQIRIETGYGSEGYITDAQASRIIRDVAVPYLSRGSWGPGLKNTMLSLAGLVAGAYKMPLSAIISWNIADNALPRQKPVKINFVSVLLISLLVLFLLSTRTGRSILFFMMLSSLSSSGRSSGGFGGGFGGRSGGGFGGFGGGMSGGGGATGRF
jgi:uncharacterized protein